MPEVIPLVGGGARSQPCTCLGSDTPRLGTCYPTLLSEQPGSSRPLEPQRRGIWAEANQCPGLRLEDRLGVEVRSHCDSNLVVPIGGARPSLPFPICPYAQLPAQPHPKTSFVITRQAGPGGYVLFSPNRMTQFNPMLQGLLGLLCVSRLLCVRSLLAHVGPGSGLRTALESVFSLNTCAVDITIVPASTGKWDQ